MQQRWQVGGRPVWWDSGGGAEVRFVGSPAPPPAPPRDLAAELAQLRGSLGGSLPQQVAWARQVHSDQVLAARPGPCGEGDALVTGERELALSVVTADCVPVLLAGGGRAAAVHAGWRGIAGRVVEPAVRAMAVAPDRLLAWIGPAIGPCCYEVGPEVAAQVVAVSGPEVARPGPAGKPHLDLPAAVSRQLSQLGVTSIRPLALCTRCEVESLASYRRQGRGAGRNLALIWLP